MSLGKEYVCYDCVRYDYENECCINYEFADPNDGVCEDFIPIGDYEYSVIGYEDDGYPD